MFFKVFVTSFLLCIVSSAYAVAQPQSNAPSFKLGGNVMFQTIIKNSASSGKPYKISMNRMLLRLEPKITLDEHWKIKARIDRWLDLETGGSSVYAENVFQVKQCSLEGKYGNFTGKIGEIAYVDSVTRDLFFNGQYKGVELDYDVRNRFHFDIGGGYPGESDFTFTFNHNMDGNSVPVIFDQKDAKFIKSELLGKFNKFSAGIGYHRVSGLGKSIYANGGLQRTDLGDINFLSLGAHYRFDSNFALNIGYDANDAHGLENNKGLTESYRIMALYKMFNYSKPGSYSLKFGYEHLGLSAVQSAWGALLSGNKGWFVGGNVVLCKNVSLMMEYFNGETINTGDKTDMFCGSLITRF